MSCDSKNRRIMEKYFIKRTPLIEQSRVKSREESHAEGEGEGEVQSRW